MSNQYFENNENLTNNPHTFNYYFQGHKIIFNTNNGVFSKNSVDFGTSLLLQKASLENPKHLLDVGCGIGVIGITMALLKPDALVEMVDINKLALELTKQNITLNETLNAKCYESNVYENVSGTFDLILTNPPIRAGKQVVHKIILEASLHLEEGGILMLVIQKKQGAESALKVLKEKYQSVSILTKDNGYYIIKCIK